jgi:hypothetical protein
MGTTHTKWDFQSKGTPENAMLKLALNGAYGKSLSKYSVLYDPKFGITVTVNGQLLMYQLCENPILDCIFIATAK